MTLSRFESLLKRIDPRLKIRSRAYMDVNGLFVGKSGKGGYIARLTKGEFNLQGYRINRFDPVTKKPVHSVIKKRGRKTVVNLLRKYRWVTKYKQASMLTFGINYPDSEVRGITRTTNI